MQQLDAVFSALADPTRRAIISRLADGEAPVSEIAEPFEISPPAISKHLKVLEQAGLVRRRVDAQRRLISLDPEALRLASGWVDQYRRFWEGSLDRLETLLAEDTASEQSTAKKGKANERTDKSRR